MSIEISPSKNHCRKHPTYELIYFNAKEGRKECAMCIIMHQNIKDKEKSATHRFCIKHPGYENSFFCIDDSKCICEKCFNFHKNHKIESVILKTQELRNQYTEFKENFSDISKRWLEYEGLIKSKNSQINEEINRTVKRIEGMFEEVIERVSKRKVEIVKSFRNKAAGIFKDYNEKIEEYDVEINDLHTKSQEIIQMNELLYSEDNVETLTKAMELNLDNIFTSYNKTSLDKLRRFQSVFESMRSKTNYTFQFTNNFNENALVDLINKQYVVKLIKTERDKEKSFEEESKYEFNELANESMGVDHYSYRLPDPNLYKVDKINKRLLHFHQEGSGGDLETDSPNSRLDLTTTIENVYEELYLSTRPQFLSEIPVESKSVRTSNGSIVLSTSTSEKYSSYLHIIKEDLSCISLPPLPSKMRKISLAEDSDFLYIYGETEADTSTTTSTNTNTNTGTLSRAHLLRINLGIGEERVEGEGRWEGILGLNKHTNYIIGVHDGWLYAFPYGLNTFKILRLQVTSLTYHGRAKWEVLNYKNPNNLNLFVNYSSYLSPLTHNNLLITSVKGALVFDTSASQFTQFSVFKVKDEFFDGFYLVGNAVMGFGARGVHVFSAISRKWTFIPLVPQNTY